MKKSLNLFDQKRYRQLQEQLRDLPWIVNGSVVAISPKTDTANTTYVWTRKVKAKTVTRALTKEQYEAFRQAIEANRRIEKVLKSMRMISETTLLNSLPGVTKKPRLLTDANSHKRPAKSS